MTKTVAVLYNPDKNIAKKALSHILSWLKKNGVRTVTGFSQPVLSAAEFAVVLGGDGTILRVARSLAPLGVPILGVNLGRVGFLAETDFKELYSTLKQALRSQLKIEERLMLQVSCTRAKDLQNSTGLPNPKGKRTGGDAVALSEAVPSGGSSFRKFSTLALNDCYIHAGSSARIVEIETSLNGKYLATYTGDGIILATPTGSTAYSLAASGPIVSPNLPVILLTPICPHTLAQRPLLVSSRDRLELIVKNCAASQFALLSVDGQESMKVRRGDRIAVEAAPTKVKLLVNPQRNYYQILREKLRWGER